MRNCETPGCTRNHDLEDEIAWLVEQVAEQMAQEKHGTPAEVIGGLAAALVTFSFKTALPACERLALDDTIEMVRSYCDQIMANPEAMQRKREMDAALLGDKEPANAMPC